MQWLFKYTYVLSTWRSTLFREPLVSESWLNYIHYRDIYLRDTKKKMPPTSLHSLPSSPFKTSCWRRKSGTLWPGGWFRKVPAAASGFPGRCLPDRKESFRKVSVPQPAVLPAPATPWAAFEPSLDGLMPHFSLQIVADFIHNCQHLCGEPSGCLVLVTSVKFWDNMLCLINGQDLYLLGFSDHSCFLSLWAFQAAVVLSVFAWVWLFIVCINDTDTHTHRALDLTVAIELSKLWLRGTMVSAQGHMPKLS